MGLENLLIRSADPSLNPKPILKGGVRILRPSEYLVLRTGSGFYSPANPINLDALLVTGMRYLEAVRLQLNPAWLDQSTGFVYLPREAQHKEASQQRERWIHIGPEKVGCLRSFFLNRRLPSAWSTWRENLVRWANFARMDPVGLSPKTTRKTFESWLAKVYPERLIETAMRQGHTSSTQARFYLNLPFTDQDVQDMKPWVAGIF